MSGLNVEFVMRKQYDSIIAGDYYDVGLLILKTQTLIVRQLQRLKWTIKLVSNSYIYKMSTM